MIRKFGKPTTMKGEAAQCLGWGNVYSVSQAIVKKSAIVREERFYGSVLVRKGRKTLKKLICHQIGIPYCAGVEF